MNVSCLNCGRPYPESGAPYSCPSCGGVYDCADPFSWRPADGPLPGIWQSATQLGLLMAPLSIGEGNTPLLSARLLDREVFLKCEFANPTGSFKDRGSATM